MPKSIVNKMVRGSAGSVNPKEFLEKYEGALREAGNRSGFKTKKSFSPSTLGYGHGTCPRYWYIAFSGAEFVEEIESKALSNMDNGTYSHERIQKNLERMEILDSKELEVINKRPPIRGFVDAVINWNDKKIPVEIKTANDGSFVFRVTTGKPSPSHYVQFLVYLRVLLADEGFLLYENKDTQELCLVPVVANDKTRKDVDYLFAWMEEVYAAFEAKDLPTRPWTRKNAKICSGCPVKDECFNRFEVGTTTIEPLEVPKP